jgi:outer membrane protein assembly factor BamD (BamD/ComL family)
MSKQNHTMYIYRFDRRCKTGERLFSTTVWQHRDEAEMKREVRELQYELYPTSKFRIEFHPTMQTVKNLMTGQDVEIDRDTPWCCNPASETFWSM